MNKNTNFYLLPVALALACGCGEPERTKLTSDAALGLLREGAQSSSGPIHPLGHEDLCLDVVWGNNRDGTPVQVSKCNGNQAQQWTQVGGMLKVYGDKCLNVTDGDNEDGTRLQIWTCAGDTSDDKNNQWTLRDHTIRWQHDDDKCLDVMSGAFASGTPVQIWDCSGSTGNINQRWHFAGQPTANPQAAPKPAGQPAASAKPAAPSASGAGESKTVTPTFEVGMHIDYDNASGNSGGLAGFVKRTQIKPTLVANYVRIKNNGTFETDTAKRYADEAAANGAKIISFAITVEPQTLGQAHLKGIQESIAYARGKGLVVELRFGYEMNGFWSPPLYDKNSPSVYKKAWAQLAPVAHAAGAYMVWCPNVAGGAPGSYQKWLPDDLISIDKLGLDYYLNSAQGQQPTVAQASSIIAGFYPVVQQVNQAHQKADTGRTVPFTFGETAVTIRDDRNNWGKSVNNETQLKLNWLHALSDRDLRAKYPLYRGFTWFDYYKTEKEGGTTGTTYHNAFELSQDPQSATMFRDWLQKLPQ